MLPRKEKQVRVLVWLAVFGTVFLSFTVLGFILFKRFSELNGLIVWIVFSQIGLFLGIYLAQKTKVKKHPLHAVPKQ